MEKKKAIIETVRVPIRLAKAKDFVISGKNKKIGLIYFLMNNSNKLECYEFHDEVNTKELNEYIRQKRCYVAATIRLVDYEAKLEELEFMWIDKSVKRK